MKKRGVIFLPQYNFLLWPISPRYGIMVWLASTSRSINWFISRTKHYDLKTLVPINSSSSKEDTQIYGYCSCWKSTDKILSMDSVAIAIVCSSCNPMVTNLELMKCEKDQTSKFDSCISCVELEEVEHNPMVSTYGQDLHSKKTFQITFNFCNSHMRNILINPMWNKPMSDFGRFVPP